MAHGMNYWIVMFCAILSLRLCSVGAPFALRGLMVLILMSGSHPFLWKAIRMRRHPLLASTGRATFRTSAPPPLFQDSFATLPAPFSLPRRLEQVLVLKTFWTFFYQLLTDGYLGFGPLCGFLALLNISPPLVPAGARAWVPRTKLLLVESGRVYAKYHENVRWCGVLFSLWINRPLPVVAPSSFVTSRHCSYSFIKARPHPS